MTEDKSARDDYSSRATEKLASTALVDELEVRVRVAQLRVQEMEAEIQLLNLMQKRRELKSGKRPAALESKRKKIRRRGRKSKAGNAVEAEKSVEE
jgi:TolA-binding protein